MNLIFSFCSSDKLFIVLKICFIGIQMILSIDQGTTGTTVFIFNKDGETCASAYNEFTQIYPKPSWVEHNPIEIWENVQKTISEALQRASLSAKEISAIGITNQRETTVVWNKYTGEPVYNAIVWQCRRTADICLSITQDGKSEWIHKKTGLVVDAYFSATKIQWILNQSENIKKSAENNELLFGTIDTWLIWKFTNGQVHATDHTNASRTLLYNIEKKCWDDELLAFFNIPITLMPNIQNSASHFGKTRIKGFDEIPITGVAGDQQAALFGQQCVTQGEAKNTYGTGCFMLMYIGNKLSLSNNGLLTTIACNADGAPAYAFEGSVFNAGSAVQWLRDELELITSASETEKIAQSVDSTNGVYMVPAFTGLGAPYWDMNARAHITGLTRGTGKKHIVRATLESIAYQTKDVLDLMEKESGVSLTKLNVDGGACANNFLMQFQADVINKTVVRPKHVESTVIGAALLAGIGASIWEKEKLPEQLHKKDKLFYPQTPKTEIDLLISGWKEAVSKTLSTS